MSLQLLTLISIVVFFTTEAASGEEVVKAVGDEVSFKLDTIVPPVTSITWKHIRDGVTVKAIEWEEGQTTTTPHTRFQGITTLDVKTGQITITNLKVEHSGVYTIDVSGKEQTQRFTLNVMASQTEKQKTEETSGPVSERDLDKASNKGCVVAAVIPSVTMVITIILFLS